MQNSGGVEESKTRVVVMSYNPGLHGSAVVAVLSISSQQAAFVYSLVNRVSLLLPLSTVGNAVEIYRLSVGRFFYLYKVHLYFIIVLFTIS